MQVALVEPGSVATPIWDKARETGEQLTVPPSLQKEYGHVPAAMDKTLQDTAKRGVPAEQVAQTIEQALDRAADEVALRRRARRARDDHRQAPAARSRLRPRRTRALGV